MSYEVGIDDTDPLIVNQGNENIDNPEVDDEGAGPSQQPDEEFYTPERRRDIRDFNNPEGDSTSRGQAMEMEKKGNKDVVNETSTSKGGTAETSFIDRSF